MADEDTPKIARDPELERAKAWWHEHGRPIVAGVSIGLAAVVGFNYWQHHQETQAESASALFEQLQTAVAAEAAAKAEDEAKAKAEAEAKAEEEAKAEAENETETETETETVAEGETDSKTETDSVAETESETETESVAETETSTETESETTAEAETVTESETETSTENAAEAETTAETETESGTETESETTAEAETETESVAETEAETETDAETETETDPELDPVVSIKSIANTLMNDYSGTPYAVHGAFALAKLAVESGDLAQAADTLQWALDHGDDAGIQHIARLRLASVLLSQGEADSVASLLAVADTGGFAARYFELAGDAHLQQGGLNEARSAYQSSLDAMEANAAGRTLVKLKLDNLGE